MGVKTVIGMDELTPFLDVRTLRATDHGVRDTVYILNDTLVLKLFEESDIRAVHEELRLLERCASLPVPKTASDILTIREKPALLYHKCSGASLQNATLDEIRQIGAFLKKFHSLTRGEKSTNAPLFEKHRLLALIEQTSHRPFFDLFERLTLTLHNDGIIHGDLFMDNASFSEGKLTCVYDLSEACEGDFLLDLAVVALSWCGNDEERAALVESYGHPLTPEAFGEYIRYAGLYYCVTRFLAGRNFDNLWEKLQ